MRSVIASSAVRSLKSPKFHSKILIAHTLKEPSINHKRNMSSGIPVSSSLATNKTLISCLGSGDLGIENTNIKTASGVSLDETQHTLVGSVLDVRWQFKLIKFHM